MDNKYIGKRIPEASPRHATVNTYLVAQSIYVNFTETFNQMNDVISLPNLFHSKKHLNVVIIKCIF